MTIVDIQAIKNSIGKLDAFGKTERGTSRLSFSPAWRQAQEFISQLMREAAMTVERDAIGNLIGTYEGREPALPYLMAGSHLDTVPEGGSLDGALGVIAAIYCVKSWHLAGYRPRRTVKVVATVEEEGTLFGIGCLGSQFLAATATAETLSALTDKQGKPLTRYMTEQGMDPAALTEHLIRPADIFAFLELHVEQGYELDLSGEPCAIVTDIVGIDRHWIRIRGHANHAGTTRMDRRKDALAAAAAFIQPLYQAALASAGAYVATVGSCSVSPGAANVIPGQVELIVETRAASDAILAAVDADIVKLLQQVETDYGVEAAVTQRRFAPAVGLSGAIIDELAAAAGAVGVKVNKMPSWAGHDAKILSQVTACGMLFVPSVNGISHSPLEATRWEDAAKGVQVFNRAVQGLANKS